MFLSKLGYSELVQRLFEKMTFSLVDHLVPKPLIRKVHPTMGISKTAMVTLNSLILDIYRKITRAAAHLSTSTKQLTLSANDVQSATKLCIPGEIGKLAVSEGSKAVTFYNQKN